MGLQLRSQLNRSKLSLSSLLFGGFLSGNFLCIKIFRRFGKLQVAEDPRWDDERILEEGEETSLLEKARRKGRIFLDNQKVSYFIYFMVVSLCIVILVELSISDYIDDNEFLKEVFRYVNFILLQFFIIEIALRVFAEGLDFIAEFINLFDMCIVISSYIMNILRIEARIVGILRILRLIKGKCQVTISN